jgi:hypothetical protein
MFTTMNQPFFTNSDFGCYVSKLMDAFFFLFKTGQGNSAQAERNKSLLDVTLHHRRKLGNIICKSLISRHGILMKAALLSPTYSLKT